MHEGDGSEHCDRYHALGSRLPGPCGDGGRSQAFRLLQPGIGARRRVARFMLLRAPGAQRRVEEVARTDPGQVTSYGETPEQAIAQAAHYGLGCEYRQHRRWRGGE